MYCRSRPQYRSDLGWILGVAFLGTLTRSARPAQGFTYVRCCSAPPASSPHGLTAPGRIVSRRPHLRAVALGSRLLPTCSAEDLHLQSRAMPGTPRTSPPGGPQVGPSLTAAARDGRTFVRAGMEEWLRRGPNKGMASNRRAKCRQTRYPDPKPATVHETGASPKHRADATKRDPNGNAA